MTTTLTHVIHLMASSRYSPCGAKVLTHDPSEKIGHSTIEIERVNCPECRRGISGIVRLYNKGKRSKSINW